MGIWDYSLYDFIRHNATASAEAPAVIQEERVITQHEFGERVDRLAAGLVKRGIAKGDRIAILAQNSAAYLEMYGACAKTGAIAAPVNWRLTPVEVRAVVELVEPKLLVVGAAHLGQVGESRVPLKALIGGGQADGYDALDDYYEAEKEGLSAHSQEITVDKAQVVHLDDGPAATPEDPFVIIATAAVAGVPRGAVLTHANLVLSGYLLASALELNSQDRNLAALPLFHISGLGLAMAMIQIGGANVVLEKLDPARAVQMMEAHSVTLLADFPPILAMLLEARAVAGLKLASLKHVLGLDAPDVIQRLYMETGAKFWTGFGQSETSGVGTLVRIDRVVGTKPGTAGLPLPLVRLRCVDEAGIDVPPGDAGEIVMQGPVVFQGYWRDPDATEYALRNGWHHTGDLGKMDADGYLYYAGRKPEKDLIKSGGENIYPVEVERAIHQIPGVAAVCVFGIPDPKWGEAVKAVVELKSGERLTAEQVRLGVEERIASYKKPQVVEFVEQLPRTPGGQVDRKAVKASYGG